MRDLTLSGYVANKTLSKPFPPLELSGAAELVGEAAMFHGPLCLYALALLWGAHASFVRPRREGPALLVCAGQELRDREGPGAEQVLAEQRVLPVLHTVPAAVPAVPVLLFGTPVAEQ